MEIFPLLCIISVCFTGFTTGVGVLPDSLDGAVGGTVMFNTTVTPDQSFYAVSWDIDGELIVSFNIQTEFMEGYRGRANLSLSTGSLQLWNLTLNDSGEYQLILTPFGKPNLSGRTKLNVYEPVSNVTLAAIDTDFLELNGSVRLSCHSSGSSLTFRLLNGSSEVRASDRVQLTDGSLTHTIVNVTRYDQGPFRCHVSNPISNGVSDPLNLSISFGPESVLLKLSPAQQFHMRGSNTTLSCSAVSRPSPVFYWFFDGDMMPVIGPELRLTNIRANQSGNYSCQAFNQDTGRNETSQPSPVSVLEEILNVSLTSSTNMAIQGNSINVTCDAAGSLFNRVWTKDGSELNPTDNMTFHEGRRVLSFRSLNKRHGGEYFCNVSNPVSSRGAKYNMVVNYGPEIVQIRGPHEIRLEETLTLICSAESRPAANYTWTLNGSEIHRSPVLVKKIQEHSDSGSYACQAVNRVTGGTSRAQHWLSVTAVLQETSNCSAGCTAGIVIACLVVFGAVVAGILIYNRRKILKTFNGDSSIITNFNGGDIAAYPGSQDLNYAVLSFNQNKTVQEGLETTSSENTVNDSLPPAASTLNSDVRLQEKSSTPQSDVSASQL